MSHYAFRDVMKRELNAHASSEAMMWQCLKLKNPKNALADYVSEVRNAHRTRVSDLLFLAHTLDIDFEFDYGDIPLADDPKESAREIFVPLRKMELEVQMDIFLSVVH